MDAVLDNVSKRAGLSGITMAAAYHHGRDVFPHNPARKVHFLEGGTVFFQPDSSRYQGRALQPLVSALAQKTDVLADLCHDAAARSLRVRAWTVFLHNYSLAAALSADIASKGVNAVVAESLHFHGLEHGFHHERYFIELGPLGRYLLGLCFCEHCLTAARRDGVDAGRLRLEARVELENRFATQPEPEQAELDRADLGSFAGGELGGYLESRSKSVASLVAECAESAKAEGADFAFIDLSGAIKGYATGRPEGSAAPMIAWQFGIDVGAVAKACGQVEAIGYAADPERLKLDLAAYRSIIGPDRKLSVIMRPMAPDCDSADNLARKLDVARAAGCVEAGFYHYGFMRLESLDLIREGLGAADHPTG